MNRTRSVAFATALVAGLGAAYAQPKAAAPAAPAAPAAAKAPTADEVMQRLEDKKFGNDASQQHDLVIIPKNAQKRNRRYTVMRKDYGDVIKLVTFLDAPTDVHGAAFMVWDNKKSDDQRWIYLPAIGQVRRLAVGDSRQSFFGSDFVFEDFTNRDPDQDTHKLVGQQKVDNRECWVVDSVPKNTGVAGFASMRSWVSKDPGLESDMLIRQELKNASGKVIRVLQAKEIKDVDGVAVYTKVWVTNNDTGSESRIEVSDIHFNTGLADERFEEAQLPRGAPGKMQTAPVKKP